MKSSVASVVWWRWRSSVGHVVCDLRQGGLACGFDRDLLDRVGAALTAGEIALHRGQRRQDDIVLVLAKARLALSRSNVPIT